MMGLILPFTSCKPWCVLVLCAVLFYGSQKVSAYQLDLRLFCDNPHGYCFPPRGNITAGNFCQFHMYSLKCLTYVKNNCGVEEHKRRDLLQTLQHLEMQDKELNCDTLQNRNCSKSKFEACTKKARSILEAAESDECNTEVYSDSMLCMEEIAFDCHATKKAFVPKLMETYTEYDTIVNALQSKKPCKKRITPATENSNNTAIALSPNAEMFLFLTPVAISHYFICSL